jgi:hypothetical protein
MSVRVCLLRRWLLGLYIIAQVVGVVSLVRDQTINIYEKTPVAGHVHIRLASPAPQPDFDHHHGLIDFHDQCCTIHSLSGPLPPAVSLALVETTATPVPRAELIACVSRHPARLDRPPKLLPPI